VNIFDRTIAVVAPGWAARRAISRLQIKAATPTASPSYSSSVQNRLSRGWFNQTNPAILTGNSQSLGLTAIWQRARSLERNNPIAGAMINRACENLVGDGFTVQATTDDSEWNAKAEDLFWDWADSADVQGRSFLRLQRLWMRSHVRDGDVGVALLSNSRLQSFESDLIATPYKVDKGLRVLDGVEVNSLLRPTGYWIRTLDDANKEVFKRYDAKDFILFGNESRLTEQRGVSYLQTSFETFDHVDDWIKSSIIAAKIAACLAVFIKKNNPRFASSKFPTATNAQGNPQPIQDLEPGMIGYLAPDEDISVLNPSQPGQSFPDQLRAMLRLLGIPMGLPLEMILLDFSQTNYSSAKASTLQAQRSFAVVQELFAEVLGRIYRWRISKAIKDNELPDRPDAWKHRWIPPMFPYLDPVKEIQAQMLEVDACQNDLTTQHIQRGGDFNKFVKRRGDELKALAAEGIPHLRSNMSAQIVGAPTPQDVAAQDQQNALTTIQNGGSNENQ
jgi:lambda family phage portal protein